MPLLLNTGPSRRGWSTLDAMRCPQLYAYRHVLRLQFPPTDPLIRGILIHVALAHHYKRMQARQNGWDESQWYEPIEAVHLLASEEGWTDHVPGVIAALCAYREKYGDDEPVRILHVEEEVYAQVPRRDGSGSTTVSYRLDLAVEGADKAVRIFDHKGVYRIDAKTPQRYTLAGNFLLARWFGAKLFGERWSGVYCNLVQMRPPYAMSRSAPGLAPDSLAMLPDILQDIEEDVARLTASGRDPWHWPRRISEYVCQTPYDVCPGAQLCCWGPKKEDKQP